MKKELNIAEFMIFTREPDYRYDELATLILAESGNKLGYVPKAVLEKHVD